MIHSSVSQRFKVHSRDDVPPFPRLKRPDVKSNSGGGFWSTVHVPCSGRLRSPVGASFPKVAMILGGGHRKNVVVGYARQRPLNQSD